MLVAGTASNVFVQNAYAANTLVINAVASDGRVLNMWTTISSGGSVVTSGLTPLPFTGTTGATYSVTVSDYGSLFFNNWDNGSTARTRTVTLNADTTMTATYRTGSTHNLVVNSADMAGNSLTGFYTIIRAGATTVRTGFTSLPFAGNHGTSYSVTVSDYGARVFDHWNDGSTARARTVTLNADTTITAHYRSNAPGYTLTVNSVGPTGNAITGYYTTVTAAGGAVVRTGFTPLTHQANSGATLVATVSDYGSNVFDRWNDGSTSRSRTVALTADTTIVAHYRNAASPPTPPPSPPSYTLAVNSADMAGNALTGYSVTIQSGSTATGTTPWPFPGIGGTAYTVTPADGGGMVFDHWENESKVRARAITLGADTTMTAFYTVPAAPGPNNFPSAVDDPAATNQNVAVTVNVLANDSDPDSDSLAIVSVTNPANGSAAVSTGGTSITYTPGASFAGTDTFDYTLSDGKGGTDIATVTITVGAVSLPPPPATYTLVVNSANMAGGTITGYYTTVTAAGSSTVRNGFTPFSPGGNPGATYSVTVSDYGSFVFDHWDDNSTARTRTVTLNANTAITAYLRDTSTAPPPSPNPDPSPIADLIPKTGVFVALYMYPGGTQAAHWQTVYDTKIAHPSVPIVAVFNPNSGPGTSDNSVFSSWVDKLKSAGVIMLGYTYSNYGGRSLDALKIDVDKYRNWYGADGLFIDEFDNDVGSEGQYRDLTAYAKSVGNMKMTMGNPGTDVPRSYIGTVDVINITEGVGYMPISWLQYCIGCSSGGWHYQEDKRNFAYIRYDISTLDTAFETESAKWVGLLYIHSGNDSNSRWFNVPSYFGTMVATLDVP